MSKQGDTILAFMVGAALGGVAALLLAPEKGSDTRKKLRRGLEDLYDRGEDLMEAAAGRARDAAGEVVDSARARVEDATSGARRHVSALREAATEARAAYENELRRDA